MTRWPPPDEPLDSPMATRPALILVGAEDLRYLAFARRLTSTLPKARLEQIEQAGHALPQERPEELGLAIGRFLRESEEAGQG